MSAMKHIMTVLELSVPSSTWAALEGKVDAIPQLDQGLSIYI